MITVDLEVTFLERARGEVYRHKVTKALALGLGGCYGLVPSRNCGVCRHDTRRDSGFRLTFSESRRRHHVDARCVSC